MTVETQPETALPTLSGSLRPAYLLLRTLLGLFALIAIATLIGSNSALVEEPTPIAVRGLADPNGLSLEQALAQLRTQPEQKDLPTQRATHPFWMLIELPERADPAARYITIQDKYLRDISVWALDEQGRVTNQITADRGLSSSGGGPLIAFDDGYAWTAQTWPTELVVRATAVGASTLSAGSIEENAFNRTQMARERLASGVTAALSSVALLIGVIGLLTSSPALLTCSVWVVSLWLVTAISLGYDLLWIPLQLPPSVELATKQLIVVGFAASTFAFFVSLFSRQLARLNHLARARTISRISFGFAAIVAVFTPNAVFMPAFLLLALAAISYSAWIVGLTLIRRPTHTARAFAGMWALLTVSILAEIGYANDWFPRLPGLSFETGAIFGALLAAYSSARIFRSERIRSAAALSHSRSLTQQYRRMYRGVPVGLLTLDNDGQLIAHNRLAAELLAAPAIANLSLDELLGPVAGDLRSSIRSFDKAVGFNFEAKIPSRDQARILHLHGIPDKDGAQIAISDISVHAELEQTLRRQITHDQLTGVLSYLGLEQKLDEITTRITQSPSEQFACVHLNLDNFSAINDVFGRRVGDEVLLETVRRLNFELAPTEFSIARPGADDFIVLVRSGSLHWTRRMAEALVASIGHSPVNYDGVVCRTTASAGVAFMLEGIPAREVLAHAQRACAVAKRSGGDQASVFDSSPSSMERYRAERYWESMATNDDLLQTLEIWAQPIVPLLDPDAPLGLEVLLRVRKDGVLVSPLDLIEAAAKVGRMPVIDKWVLANVVDLMRDDHRLLDRIGFITVNLSGASLNSHAFVDEMRSILHTNYLHCAKLCIEITEQVALVDVRSTQRLVEELRMFGVQIGLDDFGAGNTSFAYLRDLNADILKMDGAYVRNMEKDPANAKLVEGIASLSRTFGMACIAEWIEHEDTARLCAKFGIEYGQGYLFAQPAPILDWLDCHATLEASRAHFMNESRQSDDVMSQQPQ